MVRFGWHVVSFLFLNCIARVIDRIALGFFYSVEVVGYFQNAVSLHDNFFAASSPLHNVASTALSIVVKVVQSQLSRDRHRNIAPISTAPP